MILTVHRFVMFSPAFVNGADFGVSFLFSSVDISIQLISDYIDHMFNIQFSQKYQTVDISVFSPHVLCLVPSLPAELSDQSMLFGQCTRQPDAMTTPTIMWSTWSTWSSVLQSHTLAVGTCQSIWPHPQGPNLSCSPTGKETHSEIFSAL